MHMIFLMVKDNVHEVPSVPSFAKEAGIEEVVITNLCHTINLWQETQRVFVWENGDESLRRGRQAGGSQCTKIEHPAQETGPVRFQCTRMCGEPLRNLYISAEGEVSPCVYLYPPLPSPFRRIFCEKEYRIG